MQSATSNFVVPLPPVVKVEVEEQVVLKDFRGYLTRALAWTALMPLFMLAFMHFSQLIQTTATIDAGQVAKTVQYAKSLEARFASIETFLETASEMVSASLQHSQDELKERLDRFSRKMPYLTSVRLINPEGLELYAFGQSDVSTQDIIRELSSPAPTLRSFNSELCYSSSVPEDEGFSKNLVLVGCEPKSDLTDIFARSVGAEAFSMQIFNSKGQRIHIAAKNGEGIFTPQELSSEFLRVTRSKIEEGNPLWRTNQTRDNSLILSASSIPDKDLFIVFGQRLSLRDKQLLSSLLTSGAFLMCGAVLSLIVGTFLGARLTNNVQALMDQITVFKREGLVKQPEPAFWASAPKELKSLSRQFKELANEILSTQEQLRCANRRLQETVQQRTRSLSQRNQELKALQSLLTPLEEPAETVINRTVSDFKKLLNLKQLRFNSEKVTDTSLGQSVPVFINRGIVGYLNYETIDCDSEGTVASALERLAASIAIVLENQEMFSSVKSSQARFNALLESMNEGVVIIGLTGSLLYANRKAKLILDIKAEEVVTKVEEYFETRFRKVYAPELGKVQKEFFRGNSRFVSKTDADFFVETSDFLVPEFYGYKGPRQGLIIRDISEEVTLERMKRNLISVVAHELKTPVTTMRLQTETLERQIRNGLKKAAEEMLTDMLAESARLQRLIEDWLDVSRLETGFMVIKPKIWSLSMLLKKAIQSVHLRFPGLEVVIELDGNAECIRADKERMIQVFVNILENAARYNTSNAAICRIRSSQIGNKVEVSFEDNGIGVPENQLSKIFDSFYQVDMRSSRKVGGTGLGLAICRGILAAHGGKIWAEHNAIGGTTFKISLNL